MIKRTLIILLAGIAGACSAAPGNPSPQTSDNLSQASSKALRFGERTTTQIRRGGYGFMRFTAALGSGVAVRLDGLSGGPDGYCTSVPEISLLDPLGRPVVEYAEGYGQSAANNPCDDGILVRKLPMTGTYTVIAHNAMDGAELPAPGTAARRALGTMAVELDCLGGQCEPTCASDIDVLDFEEGSAPTLEPGEVEVYRLPLMEGDAATLVADSLVDAIGDGYCEARPGLTIVAPSGVVMEELVYSGSMNPCDAIVTIDEAPETGVYMVYLRNDADIEYDPALLPEDASGDISLYATCSAGFCNAPDFVLDEALDCATGSFCDSYGAGNCQTVEYDYNHDLWLDLGSIDRILVGDGKAGVFRFRMAEAGSRDIGAWLDEAFCAPTSRGVVVQVFNELGTEVTDQFETFSDECSTNLTAIASLPHGDYDVIVAPTGYTGGRVHVLLEGSATSAD